MRFRAVSGKLGRKQVKNTVLTCPSFPYTCGVTLVFGNDEAAPFCQGNMPNTSPSHGKRAAICGVCTLVLPNVAKCTMYRKPRCSVFGSIWCKYVKMKLRSNTQVDECMRTGKECRHNVDDKKVLRIDLKTPWASGFVCSGYLGSKYLTNLMLSHAILNL